MNHNIKTISLLIIIIIIFITLSIVLYPIFNKPKGFCGNDYISIVGKWKLINTTRMNNITINDTCDSEYSIEFFNNGTCRQLIDCENDSWVWENYSTYNDYIIFGDDPLPENMDYFQRIFYDVTDYGSQLSLYHAHLMTTTLYIKVK